MADVSTMVVNVKVEAAFVSLLAEFLSHVSDRAPAALQSFPRIDELNDWIDDERIVQDLNRSGDFRLALSGKDGDPGIPRGVMVNGFPLPCIEQAEILTDTGELVRVRVTMFANKVETYRLDHDEASNSPE